MLLVPTPRSRELGTRVEGLATKSFAVHEGDVSRDAAHGLGWALRVGPKPRPAGLSKQKLLFS